MLAEGLDGDAVDGVFLFHDAVVVAASEQVVGKQGFYLQVQEMFVCGESVCVAHKGVVGVEGVEYAVEHDTLGGGIGHEVGVDGEAVVVCHVAVEVGHEGVGAVLVGPILGELVEDAFAAAFAIEGGGRCGVDGDEDVGHDAAPAIDCAPAEGGVL